VILITVFGPLYFFFNEPGAGLVYIVFGLIVLGNLLVYGLWYKDVVRCGFILAVMALPTHWLITVLLGGFFNSHGVMLWGLFFPILGGLLLFPPRQVKYWFVVYAAGVLWSIFMQPWLRPSNNVPVLAAQTLLALNVLMISVFALGIMAYFVRQRDRALRLLREEQEKSEHLLLNILPAEIAAILKNENRTIADHFEGVSILFADVVNFTPMSAAMTATEIVTILNEVFSLFDTLADKYELEKIKTIGDSYMVAAGVPRPRREHAHVLTQMALEIRELVAQREFQGRRLNFRIGINSGPVVAGVIGSKKFIYDLWGDTVNTASRMESHGKANTIQITQATYDLIKDDFICEPQGAISVKGKGEMNVWHVVGRK
jgi:guanylate cyclase